MDFLCQNRSDEKESVSHLCEQDLALDHSAGSESWRLSAPSQCAFCSLHSNCLEKRTVEGNTALHYSVLHHKPESLKLLLKAKAALHTGAFKLLISLLDIGNYSYVMLTTSSFTSTLVNSAGETALDAARRLQHTQCIELVSLAFGLSLSVVIYNGTDWKH